MSKRTYTKLCETSSKNEVYDQEALKRFYVVQNDGYSRNDESLPDYDKPIKKFNDNEKYSLLSKVGESDYKYKWQYIENWKKNKLLEVSYSYEKYDECENKDCFKFERKLYNLENNKLVAHMVDFAGSRGKIILWLSPNGARYSESCCALESGAFKNKKSSL